MADVETRNQKYNSGAVSIRELRHTARVLAGTSISEAAVAACAGILAILGLVGILPTYMAPIAVITLGASLLIEGAGYVTRVMQLQALARSRLQLIAAGGGVSAEVVGGLAGLTLGILALLGITSLVLEAVAAIVFGGALLLSGRAETEVEELLQRCELGPVSGTSVPYHPVQMSNASNMLVGIAGVVLGILALVNVGAPTTLILAALLSIAAALTLSGSTLGTQMGMVIGKS
jgi:hypothetical protein